jgi:hypothetical protein
MHEGQSSSLLQGPFCLNLMSKSFKLLAITLTLVPAISENVMPKIKFCEITNSIQKFKLLDEVQDMIYIIF